MSFKVDADIVALFKGIVLALKPFATGQEVKLLFNSSISTQNSYYHPLELIPQISTFLINIISFTPQKYKVDISLYKEKPSSENCLLRIVNSGVYLGNILEIWNKIHYKTVVENLGNQGTLIYVEIPIKSSAELNEKSINSNSSPKQLTPYYLKVSQRLRSFFGTINELEASAMLVGHTEGVFLKKVNAIIDSHIHNNDFNVDVLSVAMALSRTQLFRKIKQLTKMSTGRYILFYRLQRAKQLLQSKENNFNVSEVCYEVGFVSKSHFTRSFQKQFGFPPSQCKAIEK